MKDTGRVSRREFLQSSGAAAASVSLLRIGMPSLMAVAQAACTARDEGAAFSVLGTEEAADFAAIAARIIPTTDTPGAREAGVVYFFDRALGDEMRGSLGPLRSFVDHLNSDLAGGRRFADLDESDQDARLAANEADDRFEICRVMTIFGFFAMPMQGGNKDYVGWDLIGYEGRQGAWEPPFGFYDAEYTKEHADGE